MSARNAKLVHLMFYAHAAALGGLAVLGGEALRDWLVPAAMTFSGTAFLVHKVRKTYRQATGEEADWLGA